MERFSVSVYGPIFQNDRKGKKDACVRMLKQLGKPHTGNPYVQLHTICALKRKTLVIEKKWHITGGVSWMVSVSHSKYSIIKAVKTIQRRWREAIGNPNTVVCKNRLKNEFALLNCTGS